MNNNMHNINIPKFIFLLFVIPFFSCDEACDDILKLGTVSIVDNNNEPIPNISVTIINSSNRLELCESIVNESNRLLCKERNNEISNNNLSVGEYLVLSTFNIKFGDVVDGDRLEIRFDYDETSYLEEYIVKADKCNLIELQGKQKIVVE
jgi:hypothetical protein